MQRNLNEQDLKYLISQCCKVVDEANMNLEKISLEKAKKTKIYKDSIEKLNGRFTVMLKGIESERERYNQLANSLKEMQIDDVESFPMSAVLLDVQEEKIDDFLAQKHSGYVMKKSGRPVGTKNSPKTVISSENVFDKVAQEHVSLTETVEDHLVKNQVTGDDVVLSDEEIQQLLKITN